MVTKHANIFLLLVSMKTQYIDNHEFDNSYKPIPAIPCNDIMVCFEHQGKIVMIFSNRNLY